jgi:hypothetical protein
VPHGPVNRLFGNGALSRTFGNAGYNRHLLHHWDPAVSYTRFDEMESFLMSTELAKVINGARATYVGTLLTLMRRAMRSRSSQGTQGGDRKTGLSTAGGREPRL